MSSWAGSRRIIGVDVARGLALVGMMAVHVFPDRLDPTTPHPAYTIAAGRAAALFALLAGVGLALGSGAATPPRGTDLAGARAGALARATLLVPLGLLLGSLDSPPAVILAAYGALFVLVTPFLGLSARTLVWLTAGAVVVLPVLAQLLRTLVQDPTYADLGVAHLEQPGDLLSELVLTGYYPAFVWLAYLLAGLAVGRCALGRLRVQVGLCVGGAGLAVLAKLVSAALVAAAGGVAALERSVPAGSPIGARGVDHVLAVGAWGHVPSEDARWLLVSAAHTGTPLDLAHTIGSGLAVLGAALLLTRRGPGLLLPLAAAGSMTLTLYSLHVVALTRGSPFLLDGALPTWLLQVATALVVAVAWRSWFPRGPLETLASQLDHSARRLVGVVVRQ